MLLPQVLFQPDGTLQDAIGAKLHHAVDCSAADRGLQEGVNSTHGLKN